MAKRKKVRSNHSAQQEIAVQQEPNKLVVNRVHGTGYLRRVFTHLPLLKLDMDSYQRPMEPAHIRKIVKNPDPLLWQTIRVSARDGKYYVIEGQQEVWAQLILAMDEATRETALALFDEIKVSKGSDDTKLRQAIRALPVEGDPYTECEVYTDLSVRDEARIFWKRPQTALKLGAANLFKAQLVSKEAVQLRVKKIMDEYGLKLAHASTREPNFLRAINTACYIEERQGNLAQVLKLILDVWGPRWWQESATPSEMRVGRVRSPLEGETLKGFYFFFYWYGPKSPRKGSPKADTALLERALARETIEQFEAAPGIDPLHKSKAKARGMHLLDLYNQQASEEGATLLPDWPQEKRERVA